MKITGRTAFFKSDPEYYQVEKTIGKRNTARDLSAIETDGYTLDDLRQCENIIITNSLSGEQFEREISNITEFKDIVIISWLYNER